MLNRIMLCVFVIGSISLPAACSSDDSGGGGTTNTAGNGSGSQGAANCNSRCTTAATRCGLPTSECGAACAQLSESQLGCIERSDCSAQQISACNRAGGTGGAGGGMTTGGLGDSCSCPDAKDSFCKRLAPDTGCGNLTCIGSDVTKPFCSQKCDGVACPDGSSCTAFVYQGLDVGNWCRED